MSAPVAITGVGLSCALGEDPAAVWAAIAAGRSALAPQHALRHLPDDRAAVASPSFKPWLRRRKDAKLMTRAARLALAAAGAALGDWPGERAELGLFLGVGREPPDDGEAEASLAASCRDGLLDEAALAGRGRDLYPPLLPLKTLPNMILAHISIHLGIQGDNGAWAGWGEASLQAARAGYWSVVEGRSPAALIGGADSLIELGAARDRLRLGRAGLPGEAAAVLRIEPLHTAARPLALLHLSDRLHLSDLTPPPPSLRAALGDCGAAEGALSLAFAVLDIHCGVADGSAAVAAFRLTPPAA